ncbi:GD18295 [Drosophila simulans]|uniref:GD18295 n=1 Tax=Drosophila simulans TaxID=7240 RepID=B4QT56_DROSI|nr:GD18295 [Drosophila simulans]
MVHRVLTWLLFLLSLLFTIDLVLSFTKNIYTSDDSFLRIIRSINHPDEGGNSSLTSLSRSKRVAIYNGQGVVKFVPSLAYPVKQTDKKQSFWWFFNVQGQWIPTTIPLYWWSFWNTTAFVSTAREWRKDMQAKVLHDEARTWVYNAIEVGMEQLDGAYGGVCLLRSICEISQKPFQNSNIFSEIVNAVLVPTLDNVASKYLHARNAGRGGADCERTYSDCNPLLWSLVTNMAKNPFQ